MGSLMAGWDSHVVDPKVAKYKRNKSLTRDEIEAFWKSKKQAVEEHLKAAGSSPKEGERKMATERGPEKKISGSFWEPERRYQRSNSMPLPTRRNALIDDADHKPVETKRTNGWWTRSNWAFLNERPVIVETEGRGHRQRASFYCGQRIGEQKLEKSI